MTITKQLLQELRDLEAKATSGEWEHDEEFKDPGIYTHDGGCVLFIQPHGHIKTILNTGEEFSHADARFVCAARNNLVPLLNEIEKLREALGYYANLELKLEIRKSGSYTPQAHAILTPGNYNDVARNALEGK